MLIAPRSWRAFSAAMACSRTRLAAMDTSLGTPWWPRWTVIVIGSSSATVAGVSGRVGVVEEVRTCGWETISSRSGCPPPPSTW